MYLRKKSYFKLEKLSRNLNKLNSYEGEVIGETLIFEEQKINFFNLKKKTNYFRVKINDKKILHIKKNENNLLLAQSRLEIWPGDKIKVYGFSLNNKIIIEDKENEYSIFIPLIYEVKGISTLTKTLTE